MTGREIDHLAGRGQAGPAPADVGRKFTGSGEPLHCPGNTFLCPLPADTPAHAALTRAQEVLRVGPVADAFRFLPPASFHMTVFEGVIDYRRDGDAWPAGLDRGLPVDAVTDIFAARLDGAALPAIAGVSVRPACIFGGFSVHLSGAIKPDEAALRALRARLRDLTGIRRAGFEGYRFHVTLAYPLRWLSAAEAEATRAHAAVAFDGLRVVAPKFPLPEAVFCRFDDMLAFPPVAPR